MAAVAFLLAVVEFVLVAFGVTVVTGSELHELAVGLALVSAGLLFAAGVAPRIGVGE